MKKDKIYYELLNEKKFKRINYITIIYCILISPFVFHDFVKINNGNLTLYFSNWGLFEYGCFIVLVLYSLSCRLYLEFRYKNLKDIEHK